MKLPALSPINAEVAPATTALNVENACQHKKLVAGSLLFISLKIDVDLGHDPSLFRPFSSFIVAPWAETLAS